MKVGYRTGVEEDSGRSNWGSSGARPLAWSAWYPCPSDASESRPSGQYFDLGHIRANASLADSAKFPVILMSHGTGGSAEGMGWLAFSLAQAGYIVIGAHHHGNTARETYRPEGFLCWWERATDLSTLLTALAERGPFAGRLDIERVYAAGFSLGAYTVLSLAGAVTSMNRYMEWASDFPSFQGGPREMPDAASHISELMRTSEPFRDSWARQSNSFLDSRVKALVAIAPPPPVRGFDSATVEAIETPAMLITGEADAEAPSQECADWLMQKNSHFRRWSVGRKVGHYTFLGFPAEPISDDEAILFQDNDGVSRADVHEKVAQKVLSILP
ncbi:MAG: alpha/beta hydrolase family protein [Hoeflea sp.]|uniref:alpha/beta hydrolase family protein n=1 Tax=Hoeflea sp. TaxID=1940281 RepID=UPI003EF3DCB3